MTAVSEVALWNVTPEAAAPPIATVAPLVKPVPVIVMVSPPAGAPNAGETPVTAGAEVAGGVVGCGEGLDGLEPPHDNVKVVSTAHAT